MKDIELLHEATEQEPFFVIAKPSGLASAPLAEGEDSAYTRLAVRYPALNAVCGRKQVEHGLVHRIDTATEGLLLVASTQEAFDRLQALQSENRFVKTYEAVCSSAFGGERAGDGFPPLPQPLDSIVESRFRTYGLRGSEVRPVTEQSGLAARKKASPKTYRTEIHIDTDRKTGTAVACCTLTQGFRHQVRCHLAWLGFPILGDMVYNPAASDGDPFLFRATELTFPWTDSSEKTSEKNKNLHFTLLT